MLYADDQLIIAESLEELLVKGNIDVGDGHEDWYSYEYVEGGLCPQSLHHHNTQEVQHSSYGHSV